MNRVFRTAAHFAAALALSLALFAAARAADALPGIDILFPDKTAVLYWRDPQTYAGRILDVYRGGERVGRIMVTEVTTYYVKAKVVQGNVAVGDQAVSPQTAAAPPAPRAPAPETQGMRTREPIVLEEQNGARLKKKPADESLEVEPPGEVVLRPQSEPEGAGDKKLLVALDPDKAPEHAPESVAPKKQSNGLLPDISPHVVYALGGGMYNPGNGFLSGEAGTYNIAGYARIAHRWEGSLGYSIVTPAYKGAGEFSGTAFTQKVDLARLHLSLAQAPKPGLLPSLALGAGYTFTFFKHELCTTVCAGVTGQAHGPHVLARTRLQYPFRIIAEARYQWDLESGLDGLKTDGFELSFLVPFEI